MVSGIEGVGEAITGGMVARAVEPEAGEATHAEGGNCLNCGAELAGPYCHQCGQRGHVHRTLGAFFHDLLHSVLHFEGKMWHTLPLLAWQPGELTRRYIHGERARFVSPMALFLFSVFLMFAVVSLVGGPVQSNSSPESRAQARADLQAEFEQGRHEREARIAELRTERARLAAGGRSTAPVDARIARLQQRDRIEQQALRRTLALVDAGGDVRVNRDQADGRPKAREPVTVVPNGAPESSGRRVIDLGGDRIDTGWPLLDHGIEKARDNPQLLAYKLQSNAYKFSWALIPISVPFVWLLFLHRRRYREFKAYDHTVFVTYSIAFMSLGLIALSLLRAIGLSEVIIGLAMTFVPPIHIYRDLRGAYQLGWFSALWRTAALVIIAFVAAMIFFTLLLALGMLG